MKIKKGRFKGSDFKIDEGVYVNSCLPLLASQGNWAAKNAMEIDGYTIADDPFVYGHIEGLGYIISRKDL